ncbi:MAG: carbamate kinase [Candidatus Eremiobacteraeota bacterium]|nr:carbamate kinase [Candidatus Eremiobacteraeota bacterium]
MPVAVIALGGNSLIRDARARQRLTDQAQIISEVSSQVVELLAEGWAVVLVHGNGPQLGQTLQRAELSRELVEDLPLDLAVADTQASLGYQFQQSIGNAMRQRQLSGQAVALVTQVEVDAEDPAFGNPIKAVGYFMDESTATYRREEDGWQVAEDAGRGWRRLVPFPKPKAVVELGIIRQLLAPGCCVICAGGGGIPVLASESGYLSTTAVVDKDLTAILLAEQLQAQLLLFCAVAERLSLNPNTENARPLTRLTVEEARRYLAEGHFRSGSLRPKVESGLHFVESTGGRVVITNPAHLLRGARSLAGTEIVAVEGA